MLKILSRQAQILGLVVLLSQILFGCTSQKRDEKPLGEFLSADFTVDAQQGVLVLTAEPQELKKRAQSLGLTASGERVIHLSGSPSTLSTLRIPLSSRVVPAHIPMRAVAPGADEKPDEKIYFLAKRDFAIPELLKEHPTYDGRGVIAGVIDDGVAPSGSGMQKTTDGKRKYLRHHWTSHLLDTKVTLVTAADKASTYFQAIQEDYDQAWEGVLDEQTLKSNSGATHDLNGDGQKSKLAVVVLKKGDRVRFCVDTNGDSLLTAQVECFGTFADSGEYGFWNQEKPVPVVGEFIPEEDLVRLSYGERSGDSHGEGVASVMVGHQIGGRFDGVAPGAQLLDVDFSSPDSEFLAGFYNIGRFVTNLEWLGEHGAEVVNISYSLFFESVQAQEFMAEAISALVKKYNFVISFSAGNNGPGLNSLNRRSIYPDNVLVAGAFVSRDLDAHVHGVTGLPEPGRVIYYSSRGPGPDGGSGPLLISPLSSLTHGAPENTFQAFSGTSSASPALAGAAAVLISAVKQEGLPIDAETIVHALRLSGQPLEAVPFVDQGYGLPKIPRALAVYRQLAMGEQFARVSVKVGPLSGPDGAVQKGAFLGAKDVALDREFRIRFNGELSPLVKRSAGENLLKQLKLEYSVPWLTGPAHLWLSLGLARTTVRVNSQSLKTLMGDKPGQEFFGEVYFVDADSGMRLHTLPVTVVDDRPWETKERVSFQIGSREGVRLHMGADATVKGYRIKTIIDEDKRPFLGLGFFNTMGISNLPYSWGPVEEEEFFVSTPASGDYQLTLSRVVGTEAAYEALVEANPLRMELLTKVVSGTPAGSAAEIKAINHGDAGEKLSLELVRKPSKVGSIVGELDGHGDFVAELEITEAGNYEFRLEALTPSQWTFGYDDCYYEFTSESGEVEKDWGREYAVSKEAPKGSLKFVCRPFAHSGDDFHREKLVGHLYFLPPGKTAGEVMAKAPQVRLSPGTNTIEIPWLVEETEGALLEVKIKPIYGGGEVVLGTLELP